jgi:hypothetical protein
MTLNLLKYSVFRVNPCFEPPKKVKIKKRKKWDLANLENSFLILTFLGGILSVRQVAFLKSV